MYVMVKNGTATADIRRFLKMVQAALALTLLAAANLQAPYPAAKLDGPVDHQKCSTRYEITTVDPIELVAEFYIRQAEEARITLLDDTGRKFADYRTLAFSSQPRSLFVVLSRKDEKTTARVSYHLNVPSGCN